MPAMDGKGRRPDQVAFNCYQWQRSFQSIAKQILRSPPYTPENDSNFCVASNKVSKCLQNSTVEGSSYENGRHLTILTDLDTK